MALLVGSFNPVAAAGLMCRDTVSVGWDGRCARGGRAPGAASRGRAQQEGGKEGVRPLSRRLYDCDFNQQLELGLLAPARRTVFDIQSLEELTGGGTLSVQAAVAGRCCVPSRPARLKRPTRAPAPPPGAQARPWRWAATALAAPRARAAAAGAPQRDGERASPRSCPVPNATSNSSDQCLKFCVFPL